MAIIFHRRLLSIVAALGLAAATGCQGGIGRFVPDVGMPDFLERGNEPKAIVGEQKIPSPKVTEQNFAQVQLALGDSLAKDGNFEAAQAAYEAAVRNDDKLARAYHKLALLHEKTGRGDESKDLLLQAIKLDPKNAEIVCDYGYWCYLRQEWDESEKQFERAIKLDPGLKRAHNNLGLLYARTKRPEDALQQFTLAGLSPADARANLGFVYLTQQRMPEAKTELQWAATANPSSAKARDVLASLEKVEATDQPTPLPPIDQPKALPSIAVSSPQARPPIHFNQAAPAAEAPGHAAIATRRARAMETAPEVANPGETSLASEPPRQVAMTNKPIPVAEAPPHTAIANKPANQAAVARPIIKHDLPTRNLAPVLSDYQLPSTASKPASAVELTEYRNPAPATPNVERPNTESRGGESIIRFRPRSADPPHGA
jgi:Tfp pilus assembly protein PilF